jgi:cytochrome c-type biogenesis protein CcmH/NrfF
MTLPAVFMIIGTVMLIEAAMFASRAERATGTVVSVERIVSTRGSSRNPSHSYRPTIQYSDQLGQEQQAVTHISAGSYGFATGERLDILYDPHEPGVVRIAGAFSLWGLPILFIAIGATFLSIIRLTRRKAAAAAAEQQDPTVRRG